MLVAGLGGCDDGTQTTPAADGSAGSAAAAAAAGTPGATTAAAPTPATGNNGRTVAAAEAPSSDSGDAAQASTALLNDPSAPSNTPLCGFAAQENNALSRQLMARQYAEAGQCSAYACYDAATATYIGADGYRHVCR